MTKILGQTVVFDNPELLKQALTHRSAGKNNNERLEFLGDSILSFVITKWLYQNYKTLSEGKLTRVRSSLVKGATLAEVGRHYQISDQMILGVGELKSGGFNRSSVLADMVESIFAAVFLDKGIDFVESFILSVMQKWLDDIDPNVSDKDAKTRLQEFLQKRGYDTPDYQLLEEVGKDHLKTFKVKCQVKQLEVSAEATQRSLKKAEKKSAELVLNILLNNNE